jgi:hypothetical protein
VRLRIKGVLGSLQPGCDSSGAQASPSGIDASKLALVEAGDGEIVVDSASGEVLEALTEALRTARFRGFAASRYASALAEAVAGGAVRLGRDDAGEMILLDDRGNEVMAGPGEGLELRAAALLLLESQTPYGVVGQHGGRLFGMGGSGFGASLRYAPAYQRRLSIRSRKKAREAIRQLRRRLWSVTYDTKEAGRVLPVAWTLTTPTLDPSIVPGVCEAKEEERMLLAWSLFRKLDLFKATVFAAFRGFEVTRKAFWDGVVCHHPHFHLLAWARYVPQADLAAAWWACLRTATGRTYGFELADLYPDQESAARAVTACVQVQAVKRRTRRGDGSVSLEDAIQETLKYCTKADDIACYVADPEHPGEWIVSGLPCEYLREGIWRRSPRVFECVGGARSRWKAPDWCEPREGLSPELLADLAGEAARRAGASCSLDTPAITDGAQVGQPSKDETRRRETLRGLMLTMDLHAWLQIAARRAFAALEHLEEGLRGKGYWIPALEGGPPG